MNNDNYPLGADNKSAPFNQKDQEYIEFEVLCSQTLSKTVTVVSNNYTEIIEQECDIDGFVYMTDYDTSNVNWKEEFKGDNHYSPYDLIQAFKECLQKQLEGKPIVKTKAELEYLISECDNWTVDEEIFVED